jgi:glyoxylase-like metal-dependent hydrolase (beta-lactamase superfamily II)
MKVLVHSGGVAMTNAILVADETSREAVLFDAPDHTAAGILDEAANKGWNVPGLWLTHGHFDHFADHPTWRKRFPKGKSRIHSLEAPKVLHPQLQTRLFGLPFDIPPLQADSFVTDGEELQIGSIQVKVLHTPGHSAGHVCYYIPTEKLLIGGDLIIGGSVGRTDLPDSNPADLQKSLQRVMSLPDDTTLIGGHGPATTLGEERETNPFVRMALGLD